MASQVQQKWEQNTASIFQPALPTVCMCPCSQEIQLRKASQYAHVDSNTHTQMQAHNVHLYELLRHVYSGSMEHRDLKGLSKGTSHIVTFSWERGAQIEDEWQMRVQMRMCLMQREWALGMSVLSWSDCACISTLMNTFSRASSLALWTATLVGRLSQHFVPDWNISKTLP